MKRSLLALVAATAVGITVLALRPTPTFAANAPLKVMIPCAYEPDPLTINQGDDPTPATLTRVAGADCANHTAVLSWVSGPATAGFDTACTQTSTSIPFNKPALTLYACTQSYGVWRLRIYNSSSVLVQTLTINIIA